LRLIEKTPVELAPSVLLNMVAASARVLYPAQMLKAAEACFVNLDAFSYDLVCQLVSYLVALNQTHFENKETKTAQITQLLTLHLEEIYTRKAQKEDAKFRTSHLLQYLEGLVKMVGEPLESKRIA